MAGELTVPGDFDVIGLFDVMDAKREAEAWSFTVDPSGGVHPLLPDPSPGRWRWWWAHHDLAAEVDGKRRALDLSWKEVAEVMGLGTGGAAVLKGMDELRYGPPIGLAMIAARWVQRSAASFMSELPPSACNPPKSRRRC